MPIISYTCTQHNIPGFLDHGQCTVSDGLRTCAIKEGARPALLSSSTSLGFYGWASNTFPYPNPFVVLDIPQGWCVGSVRMMFVAPGDIPTLSLSVHSAERLSNNTDRTMFSLVSEAVTRLAVMNLTALARGKYLRINMTSTGRLYLLEIEVFGTSRYTFTDTRDLHDMLHHCHLHSICPLSQMIASVHIHPQLVVTLLAQPPQSAHLLIQPHLSVSTQFSCVLLRIAVNPSHHLTVLYMLQCLLW